MSTAKINTRILVVIASYGTTNDIFLERIIREYREMSFDAHIVVTSNLEKRVPEAVELRIGLPTADPWSLPFAHKEIFAENAEAYDLFIYTEDDTLITERNVRAFVDVNGELPEDEVAGLLRFERSNEGHVNYPEVHGHFHWLPESVRRHGHDTFASFTCEHAASYLVTRWQLKRAIESGGFLVGAHRGKYDLACTASTDVYTQCGFRKVICISRIDDFLVHHLPNKYIGTRFGVHDAEFRRQIRVLMFMGQNGHYPQSLVNETKLRDSAYSKDYYEPVRHDIASLVPRTAHNVLSVGCGWGATEAYLAQQGLSVVAVPVDVVISGGAQAAGVQVVPGDFEQARERLEGKKFDCLLLLNVLHLVPDPVRLLRTWSTMLTPDCVVLAVVPNLWSVQAARLRILEGEMMKSLRGYNHSGVQAPFFRTLKKWFKSAGLKPSGMPVPSSWTSREFVMVATPMARTVNPTPGEA